MSVSGIEATQNILQDPLLLRQQCYVNGEWLSAESGKFNEVKNPATAELVGRTPDLSAEEINRVIQKAEASWQDWRERTAEERADLLLKWHQLLLSHQEDLAKLMSLEQGKPLAEAQGEIVYGASFIRWFAEEARRVYGDVIPAHQKNKRIVVLKQPIGVVAAITPWNFPNAMITRKAAPALAAGCPIIVRPASQTPFSALALAELAHRAGFPKGIFNVVTGKASNVANALIAHPSVRKVSFTGSTEVGKSLMRNAADTLKKLSMELGGNAPFIVFEDADLDAAAEGLMISKFRNTGQTCVCTNRVIVAKQVLDEFTQIVKRKMQSLVCGNGLDEGVNQGPLIDDKAVAKMEEHIQDALSKGAQLVLGGKKHAFGGHFYEPTLLTQVKENMLVAKEETFGPLAPFFSFDSEKEAIELANATEFGLAAYFYSRDISRIWRVAEAIESGMVGINTGLVSTTVAPFGGVKESGFGREGSKYGIEDYLQIKYLCLEV